MARTEGTYINPTHFDVAAQFSTAISAGRTTGALKSPTSAASSTPALFSSTYITIECPDYAAELKVIVSAAAFITEDVNWNHYTTLVADTEYVFGCGGMDNIYIVASGADSTIYYAFHVKSA